MNASPARFLHWSNALTYIAIFAGLLTVVSAEEFGNPGLAGIMIAVVTRLGCFDVEEDT